MRSSKRPPACETRAAEFHPGRGRGSSAAVRRAALSALPPRSLCVAEALEVRRLLTAPLVQALVVNDGTAQRSKVTGLTVTFDQPVTLAGGAVELAGRGGAGTGTASVVSNPSGDGRTYLLAFATLAGQAEANATVTLGAGPVERRRP